MQSRDITLSVVSHCQAELVQQLLDDIERTGVVDFLKEVIIINNIPDGSSYRHNVVPLTIITNSKPKGFGENHNAAFQRATGDYFCVVNPDIRIYENPFPMLIRSLCEELVAVSVPFVYSPNKLLDDNIRYFPSLRRLLIKPLKINDGRYPVRSDIAPYDIEWGAGMFMLFKTEDYRAIGGFDENFYLYYEDVDICTRLWKAGKRVVAVPTTKVTHDAQRASHKNFKYFRWHLSSMFRYFLKHWFRLPQVPKQ